MASDDSGMEIRHSHGKTFSTTPMSVLPGGTQTKAGRSPTREASPAQEGGLPSWGSMVRTEQERRPANDRCPCNARADPRLDWQASTVHVQGVARMVTEDRYCVGVQTQITAAQRASSQPI